MSNFSNFKIDFLNKENINNFNDHVNLKLDDIIKHERYRI